MKSEAILSVDRKYRYVLTRTWDETLPNIMFVGLNPSTADETTDDPTIRRCINFAKSWGYGGLYMVNLFAYRSTNPNNIRIVDNPIGDIMIVISHITLNYQIRLSLVGAIVVLTKSAQKK